METVKVKSDIHEDGYYVINEVDFDPKVHTKYVERKPRATKKKTSEK